MFEGFDWKKFAIGCAFAAGYAVAEYCKVLPGPAGAAAGFAAIILAQLSHSPRAPRALPAGDK